MGRRGVLAGWVRAALACGCWAGSDDVRGAAIGRGSTSRALVDDVAGRCVWRSGRGSAGVCVVGDSLGANTYLVASERHGCGEAWTGRRRGCVVVRVVSGAAAGGGRRASRGSWEGSWEGEFAAVDGECLCVQ
ncbi:hypothetical protein P280DRAFT_171872 [Massarina eburnea CBS 473.64]|uniref:Uncharacterized protein n=1 Tax=Massarina eburnea CBS 473.64 TaxID=1395130 RepID=A0A6A6SB67_9PLEO|nr:hypothetical protein P280DRAFT_171872 [Massarina eburnea CBS 473.64]